MIIKVTNDLKKQDIWANGVELASIMGKDRIKGKRVLVFPETKKMHVHTFSGPVLMTDTYKISKLDAIKRDTLFALFGHKPRIVEYDGISTYWDESHVNVWCPSIDTLLFAKALKKIKPKLSKFKTGIEIGCGSGFLSKYVLEKNKNFKNFIVNDISKYAIKSAKDNINSKSASFYIGDGINKIKGKKFDLMICNPPYVPRPGSIGDNPYEGINLLKYFLQEGQKHLNPGGIIITNISSLCEDMVLETLPTMKMTVLEKMTVPLKVNNIMNNKVWLNYLLKQRHLQKKHKGGYDYWQGLKIVMLENK